MYTVLIISVIIVIIVLILSVVTTSKAYQYKHTVDPIDSSNNHKDAIDASEENK
ncbi:MULTISPECIES: YtzI protein [unclassified Bacillus (in: firmicutes)]|uniref:YtzI protein n=1 Tax=unclassified Bacillus (in: firmicutes) TaxID=185979 RepID=UPI001BE551E9|nr:MULTISPECIES: YtzI protein [unclassified Bacillus (in: firmicutes)]MBT2640546.1 YtzI protein [Bacillus sp. ISL-39]MBT2662267.1 YtzI protein [Bacillus sp. ISL-45]